MKKEKIEKEGKNESQDLYFVFSNAFGCPHVVYKILKPLAQIEAEKSVTENFVREKEKQTNKGTDKPYVADSFIHFTTCHT